MMNPRIIFASIFTPLIVILGEAIHHYGRRVLNHAFGENSSVAQAVTMLLRFGWYIIGSGLLF